MKQAMHWKRVLPVLVLTAVMALAMVLLVLSARPAAATPATGTIVFQKAVTQGDPDNPTQGFTFNIKLDNSIISGLADVQPGTGPFGSTDLTADLTYTVNELNIPPGWTLDDISCVDSAASSTFGAFTSGDTSIEVNLVAGGYVTCTFTNSFTPTGRLTVIKETDPDGGTGFPFTLVGPDYLFDFKFGRNGGDGTAGSGNGQFNTPVGVAVDTSGNIYVADSANNRIQKFSSSGSFLAVWGKNGGDGSLGDGDVEFNFPAGVAVDASGNIYVLDQYNNRVQMLDSSGNLVRMWGWGVLDNSAAFQVCTGGCQAGSDGDGDGQLYYPGGLAVDAAGIVTVVDGNNQRIQQFDSSDGSFVRMWGWGVQNGAAAFQVCTGGCQIGLDGAGDGQFYYPGGVAVDSSNNVYVADTYNNRIQKFDSSGTFLAKWGSIGIGNGDFYYPYGAAVDAAGNVFVADTQNNRIQKFDSSANFVAQFGATGAGNGQFNFPYGVAVSGSKVIVADSYNHRIQVFKAGPAPENFTLDDDQSKGFDLSPGQYVISETVPSGWTLDNIDCGGDPITGATSATVDLAGVDNVVCTFTNEKDASLTIAKVTDPTGGTDFPFTVDPGHYLFEAKWGKNGGDGTLGALGGEFEDPWGIDLDDAGNVYIVDSSNNRIQKLDSSGNFLMAFGWDVIATGPNDNGTGFEVCTPADTCKTGTVGTNDGQFDYPSELAVDAAGNIYVADYRNDRIQVFDSNGSFLFKWGKNGGDGTVGFLAGEFFSPLGVAFDAAGNVYVSDTGNYRIQKFDSSGNFLMAFGWDVKVGGGTGLEVCLPSDTCKQGTVGAGDGQLYWPAGLVVDAAGNIYVADSQNHRIQVFDSSGNFLFKWGKNGGDGSGGGGLGEFFLPWDVTFDNAGNVYVADVSPDRFQKFDSSGNFLNTFGTFGTGDGQFHEPYYLAVDATGKVYMTDSENNRVQIITHALSTILDHGQDDSFTMEPGTYLVSELVPAGWTLTDIDCGAAAATRDGNTVKVTLGPDEHHTCTFTNTQPPEPTTGTIEVIKSANPADDTVFRLAFRQTNLVESPTIDFSLQDPSDDTETFSDQPAGGSFSVIEFSKPGWGFEGASCTTNLGTAYSTTASGVTITNLVGGDTVSCTFNNAQCQPGFHTNSFPASPPYNVCIPAAPGSYVPGVGGTEATPCPAGRYQDQEGQDSCKLADPGYYVPEPGADEQIECPEGTTSEAGATECTPISANACPVVIGRSPIGDVGYRMTDIAGNGMGDNRRFRAAARITIPDYADVVALYGQMAGKGPEYTSNKVRFIYPDGSRLEDFVQNSVAYQLGAIHWYGVELDAAELSQGPNSLKGKMRSRWYLTREGRRMRTPRAVVYYLTYQTDEQYANVMMLFDDSSLNHVAWEADYTAAQDFAIDIPETQDTVDVLVKLAIVGMDRDPRVVILDVEAGGVLYNDVLVVPSDNPSLNIVEVLLQDVPAGTSVVNVHLESPEESPTYKHGGDSAALVGAAVNYACGEEVDPR